MVNLKTFLSMAMPPLHDAYTVNYTVLLYCIANQVKLYTALESDATYVITIWQL